MKVVINRCYGQFHLKNIVLKKYLELKGEKAYFYKRIHKSNIFYQKVNDSNIDEKCVYCVKTDLGETVSRLKDVICDFDIARDDEMLIKAIETIGLKESAEKECNLKIVEIPDDIDWKIVDEDDGKEVVKRVCQMVWY